MTYTVHECIYNGVWCVGRSARKPSQKIDRNPDRVSTSALPFAAA